MLENKETNEIYVVPFHVKHSPSIEKSVAVKVFKEIKTPENTYKAFCMVYACLVNKINPASATYNGYKFEKHLIQIRHGGHFEAFAAYNLRSRILFIIPVDFL